MSPEEWAEFCARTGRPSPSPLSSDRLNAVFVGRELIPHMAAAMVATATAADQAASPAPAANTRKQHIDNIHKGQQLARTRGGDRADTQFIREAIAASRPPTLNEAVQAVEAAIRGDMQGAQSVFVDQAVDGYLFRWHNGEQGKVTHRDMRRRVKRLWEQLQKTA